jgi:hypothetical protein
MSAAGFFETRAQPSRSNGVISPMDGLLKIHTVSSAQTADYYETTSYSPSIPPPPTRLRVQTVARRPSGRRGDFRIGQGRPLPNTGTASGGVRLANRREQPRHGARHRGQAFQNFPVEVPANQGIFVADTRTGTITKVARTGEAFSDFLYWNFSGRPPGVGGSEDESEDGEPPRWRSSAFVSVSRDVNGAFLAAFKARQGEIDPVENNYIDPVDGLYVGNSAEVSSLLDTKQSGQALDPAAPEGSLISTLAIERESFRGTWLAVTASMLAEGTEESLSGIYLTTFPNPAVVNSGGNPEPQKQLTAKERKREIKKLKNRIANLREKLKSLNASGKKTLRMKKQQLRLRILELRQELALLRSGK